MLSLFLINMKTNLGFMYDKHNNQYLELEILPSQVTVFFRPAFKIEIFKCNYLKSDSVHNVKTKNAPFCLNFPSIYKLLVLLSDWTGPLKDQPNNLQSYKNEIFGKTMKNG